MIPGMGMNYGGTFNGTYMFNGTALSLETKMNNLTPDDLNKTKQDVNLNITGQLVQEYSICGLICTIFWDWC